jgi:glycosyltransferase involved in cell wall biosynthesis
LPNLVQALAGEARFTIHSGPVDTASDPLVQRAHRRLRALAGTGLTLLERPLAPAEYLNQLHAADLVLLPYDARAYGPRSSGILAEARAAGVPAVVPAGCWMADAVGPDPGLTFCGASGLVAAVRDALARLPALQEEWAAAAPAWRQLHSPAALLSQLLAETV